MRLSAIVPLVFLACSSPGASSVADTPAMADTSAADTSTALMRSVEAMIASSLPAPLSDEEYRSAYALLGRIRTSALSLSRVSPPECQGVMPVARLLADTLAFRLDTLHSLLPSLEMPPHSVSHSRPGEWEEFYRSAEMIFPEAAIAVSEASSPPVSPAVVRGASAAALVHASAALKAFGSAMAYAPRP